MMNTRLSATTRKRLHIQGYTNYTDEALNEYKYGIRFAYIGCGTIVAFGLLLQSTILWELAIGIAFFAVILPYHPIDYIYNYGYRHLINKPPLPVRTNQAKFACSLATVWLTMVITLFSSGYTMAANILVVPLLIQAVVVGTIDFCVPSMIYNALNRMIMKRKSII